MKRHPPFIVILVDRRLIVLVGRLAWAMKKLIEAGSNGCSQITHPAPRWSSYVHQLRQKDLRIDAVLEDQGGPFPGRYARYILRAKVKLISDRSEADTAAIIEWPGRTSG